MRVDLVILNYNGRELLDECLPSLLAAARHSAHDVRVVVIDNASTDDSVTWLRANHPAAVIFQQSNRGLCSFNEVLPRLDAPVAVLLNNDIRLAVDALDPLVAALEQPSANGEPCLMAAPLCLSFDGAHYQGQQTAICWRWGLVQATSLYSTHEENCLQPGLTASAGAAIAVWRSAFIGLGGFDHRYLPGRLEDLDLAYRAYQSGYCARHVPASIAYHKGAATFSTAFGPNGCDQLALRNTLLFQWKHLTARRHRWRQTIGGGTRLLFELCTTLLRRKARRSSYWRAWREARALHRQHRTPATADSQSNLRVAELSYFRRFHPRCMHLVAEPNTLSLSRMRKFEPATTESTTY